MWPVGPAQSVVVFYRIRGIPPYSLFKVGLFCRIQNPEVSIQESAAGFDNYGYQDIMTAGKCLNYSDS